MILEKFFPKKGVDGNLTKLSSKSVMMRNGWIIDVEFSNGEDKDENNEISCQSKQFYGYKEGIAVGSVSTIFKGSGKANFKYENCGKRGYVTVSLNGIELERIRSSYSTVSFQYHTGDLLEIKEVNSTIMELHYLDIMDGGK